MLTQLRPVLEGLANAGVSLDTAELAPAEAKSLSSLPSLAWLRCLHDLLLLQHLNRLGDHVVGRKIHARSALFSSPTTSTSTRSALQWRRFCYDALHSKGYPASALLLPILLSTGHGVDTATDMNGILSAIVWSIGTAKACRAQDATPSSPPPKAAHTPRRVRKQGYSSPSAASPSPPPPPQLTPTEQISALTREVVSSVRKVYLEADRLSVQEAAYWKKSARFCAEVKTTVLDVATTPHAEAAMAMSLLKERRASAAETHPREQIAQGVLEVLAATGPSIGDRSAPPPSVMTREEVPDVEAALLVIDSAMATLERPSLLLSIKRAWKDYKDSVPAQRFQALKPLLVSHKRRLLEQMRCNSWGALITDLTPHTTSIPEPDAPPSIAPLEEDSGVDEAIAAAASTARTKAAEFVANLKASIPPDYILQ